MWLIWTIKKNNFKLPGDRIGIATLSERPDILAGFPLALYPGRYRRRKNEPKKI